MFKCSVYKQERGTINLKYVNTQEKFYVGVIFLHVL